MRNFSIVQVINLLYIIWIIIFYTSPTFAKYRYVPINSTQIFSESRESKSDESDEYVSTFDDMPVQKALILDAWSRDPAKLILGRDYLLLNERMQREDLKIQKDDQKPLLYRLLYPSIPQTIKSRGKVFFYQSTKNHDDNCAWKVNLITSNACILYKNLIQLRDHLIKQKVMLDNVNGALSLGNPTIYSFLIYATNAIHVSITRPISVATSGNMLLPIFPHACPVQQCVTCPVCQICHACPTCQACPLCSMCLPCLTCPVCETCPKLKKCPACPTCNTDQSNSPPTIIWPSLHPSNGSTDERPFLTNPWTSIPTGIHELSDNTTSAPRFTTLGVQTLPTITGEPPLGPNQLSTASVTILSTMPVTSTSFTTIPPIVHLSSLRPPNYSTDGQTIFTDPWSSIPTSISIIPEKTTAAHIATTSNVQTLPKVTGQPPLEHDQSSTASVSILSTIPAISTSVTTTPPTVPWSSQRPPNGSPDEQLLLTNPWTAIPTGVNELSENTTPVSTFTTLDTHTLSTVTREPPLDPDQLSTASVTNLSTMPATSTTITATPPVVPWSTLHPPNGSPDEHPFLTNPWTAIPTGVNELSVNMTPAPTFPTLDMQTLPTVTREPPLDPDQLSTASVTTLSTIPVTSTSVTTIPPVVDWSSVRPPNGSPDEQPNLTNPWTAIPTGIHELPENTTPASTFPTLDIQTLPTVTRESPLDPDQLSTASVTILSTIPVTSTSVTTIPPVVDWSSAHPPNGSPDEQPYLNNPWTAIPTGIHELPKNTTPTSTFPTLDMQTLPTLTREPPLVPNLPSPASVPILPIIPIFSTTVTTTREPPLVPNLPSTVFVPILPTMPVISMTVTIPPVDPWSSLRPPNGSPDEQPFSTDPWTAIPTGIHDQNTTYAPTFPSLNVHTLPTVTGDSPLDPNQLSTASVPILSTMPVTSTSVTTIPPLVPWSSHRPPNGSPDEQSFSTDPWTSIPTGIHGLPENTTPASILPTSDVHTLPTVTGDSPLDPNQLSTASVPILSTMPVNSTSVTTIPPIVAWSSHRPPNGSPDEQPFSTDPWTSIPTGIHGLPENTPPASIFPTSDVQTLPTRTNEPPLNPNQWSTASVPILSTTPVIFTSVTMVPPVVPGSSLRPPNGNPDEQPFSSDPWASIPTGIYELSENTTPSPTIPTLDVQTSSTVTSEPPLESNELSTASVPILSTMPVTSVTTIPPVVPWSSLRPPNGSPDEQPFSIDPWTAIPTGIHDQNTKPAPIFPTSDMQTLPTVTREPPLDPNRLSTAFVPILTTSPETSTSVTTIFPVVPWSSILPPSGNTDGQPFFTDPWASIPTLISELPDKSTSAPIATTLAMQTLPTPTKESPLVPNLPWTVSVPILPTMPVISTTVTTTRAPPLVPNLPSAVSIPILPTVPIISVTVTTTREPPFVPSLPSTVSVPILPTVPIISVTDTTTRDPSSIIPSVTTSAPDYTTSDKPLTTSTSSFTSPTTISGTSLTTTKIIEPIQTNEIVTTTKKSRRTKKPKKPKTTTPPDPLFPFG